MPVIRFFFSIKPGLRIAIVLVYLAIIALLSLLPAYDLPTIPLFTGADKIIHFCMYCGLSFLFCWGASVSPRHVRSLLFILAGSFLWGALMEVLQRAMHLGRSFEVADMVANFAGAAAGLLVYRFFERKKRKETG